MSYRFMKVAAAAAAVVATPVMAQAHPVAYATSSPVEIVAFDVANQNIVWTDDGFYPAWGGAIAAYVDPGSIKLRFINRSAVPATSVTFVVKDGGHIRSIVDKGNFRPGVLIEHSFGGNVGSSGVSIATFAVAEVDFADGTVWHVVHTDEASAAIAEAMDTRRAELEQVNAEARRVAFRHLGTSL